MFQILNMVTHVIYSGYRIKCRFNRLNKSVMIYQLGVLNGNKERLKIITTNRIRKFNQPIKLSAIENKGDNIYG